MIEIGNKVSFGLGAIVGGQKNAVVNAEPQLIANSTPGKFTITSPVSKAMNIAVGENIQFVNNIDGIEREIAKQSDKAREFAEAIGVDLTTREGQLAVIEAATQWFITKGIAEVDSKGNPIMVSARLTEDEKRAYIKAHAEEFLATNREALIERVGNADATDEELVAAIGIDEVEYPKVQSFTGSKTATTSNATGVGLQLGFTDSAVWNSLKANLGDDKAKKNRVYDVLLDKVMEVEIEGVTRSVYPIIFKEDADPVVRAKKEA